ncbi:hypothetical protein AOLI_G00035390 [Acnodon oligacanthus]
MRPWAGSWRWIALVLLAWGTLLFYIGGHLVRDSEYTPRSSRELAKILTKLERLKQQNEDLRRMAQALRTDTILKLENCHPSSYPTKAPGDLSLEQGHNPTSYKGKRKDFTTRFIDTCFFSTVEFALSQEEYYLLMNAIITHLPQLK